MKNDVLTLIICNELLFLSVILYFIANITGFFNKHVLPSNYQHARVAYFVLILIGKIAGGMYTIFVIEVDVIKTPVFTFFSWIIGIALGLGLTGLAGLIATLFISDNKSCWYNNFWINTLGKTL